MPRRRLLWQLYPSYLLLIVLSLSAVTWHAIETAERFHHRQTADYLAVRARLVERVLAEAAPVEAREIDRIVKELGRITDTRITLIYPDGVVAGDSEADPATMESHADRPEVQQALTGRVGESMRRSPTLREPMFYVAVPAADRGGRPIVIRTSVSLSAFDRAVGELQLKILLVGIGVAVLAAGVGLFVSRRIARPIEEMKAGVERLAAGDLGHRLHMPACEEVAGLAEVINQMAAQLEERIETITAQRNEQEAVFASMAEGVIAFDTRERVLRMNQAAGELIGHSPAEAQGRTLHEVVRNTELQRFVMQSLSSADSVDGEVHLHEGPERCIQAHGAMLRDAAGRRIGAVVVLNDLTRIRTLENFRRDFVGNVSHELRTPITCIKGFVETLLDGAIREPEAAAHFLGIIARQVDRLNAIINDLLLLSRIEQQGDQGALTTAPMRVSAILGAAVELCGHKAQAKSIALSVRCDEALTADVNAPLLEQAVVNLVDNAIQYSEPGKTVRIEAERLNDGVVLSVRDEGCGISAEHLDRIFERFYRVDKGRSREAGGTGLGLSIVKHIARAHGGEVTVTSEPGKGSTFSIVIPGKTVRAG